MKIFQKTAMLTLLVFVTFTQFGLAQIPMGECNSACNKAWKDCKLDTKSCKSNFDKCKEKCNKEQPGPSPSPSPEDPWYVSYFEWLTDPFFDSGVVANTSHDFFKKVDFSPPFDPLEDKTRSGPCSV